MNVLIVEDEARIAKRLERMTREIWEGRDLKVQICDNLTLAERYLSAQTIDVLLLDLNLNSRDGFDLLKEVASQPFHTIVVSAHWDRAIEAFEHGVLDFVPKPFGKERLTKALERVENSAAPTKAAAKYLSIRKRGEIQLIAVETVQYIKGSGAYSEIYLRTGGTELHSKRNSFCAEACRCRNHIFFQDLTALT